jgi:hypothetical protein
MRQAAFLHASYDKVRVVCSHALSYLDKIYYQDRIARPQRVKCRIEPDTPSVYRCANFVPNSLHLEVAPLFAAWINAARGRVAQQRVRRAAVEVGQVGRGISACVRVRRGDQGRHPTLFFFLQQPPSAHLT